MNNKIMRKMTAEDINAVISLVNDTFKPPMPMDRAFPFIFTSSNTYSYVLEIEGEIVSFMGVVPIQWQNYYGVSIGAVCTDIKHQGKGLLRELFPYAINELKTEGVDFILVSGSGKVYMENGAQFFGTFYNHKITENDKKTSVDLIEYRQDTQGLYAIHQLLDEKQHYQFGVNELSVFLAAQGAASVLGMSAQNYLVKQNGEIKAFLTHTYDEKRSRIMEHAGDMDCIISAIAQINHKLGIEETILVSDKLMPEYKNEKINNEGTIIYTKEALKETLQNLPYALGLRFI